MDATMTAPEQPGPNAQRILRYLDDQDEAVAAARVIANDERASAEERAAALQELETIRTRLEQRAPTHIDRLLTAAVDPSAAPALRAISRRFFTDLGWLRDEDFTLHTRDELRTRIVELMKAQGRWPDGVD
jgi:hypothetical protein